MTGRPPFLVAAIAVLLGIGTFLGVRVLAPQDRAPLVPGASTTSPAVAAASSVPTAPPTSPPTPRPSPGHEVYGYLPYWEMDEGIALHLAEVELTTLALFSVTHRRDGELDTAQPGYARLTGARGQRVTRDAQRLGTRVELVYTSFGRERNREFFEDRDAQDRWIENLVTLTLESGFDGINVDVELLSSDLVEVYGEFVGRLRAALREAAPDGQVSVATQANETGAAMAAAAARAGADRIFLMGYDYRWSGSEPGASAPLDRIDGGWKTLAWSLDLYESLGVPVERTVLGLPLYGMTWPAIGPEFGAPAAGRGEPWIPRRNVRVLASPAFAPTYDEIESVEFYAVPAPGSPPTAEPAEPPSGRRDPGGPPDPDSRRAATPPPIWNAVYYDSPRSLRPKLLLADDRGLAGAGFWAIGYERGLPGYRELINRFRAGTLRSTTAP